VDLGRQGRNVDFTNAAATRPVKAGTTVPSTCTLGDLFFQTGATVQNIYGCFTTNSWALLGSNTVLADPGASGIVKRTTANTTVAVAAPTGTIVGTSDAQTLTNKSIDASEINTGLFPAGRLPAFSGDITTAAGSTATTLATVNTTPGTFGDASHSVQLTIDAKGRITGATSFAISGSGSGALVSSVNSVSYSASPSFDVSQGDQSITLTGDVTSSTLSHISAGQLVSFRVCQDAAGGHAFAWPASVHGAIVVGQNPNTCSVQLFKAFDGTAFWPVDTGIINIP
jgi:hypothetical protein